MKIEVSKDKILVQKIKEKLKETGGYCPCRIERTEDTKCICKEFLEQPHTGYCHCGLYYKQEV